MRILQPLGSMKRGQFDRIRVFILTAFQHGDQGNSLHQVIQTQLIVCRFGLQPGNQFQHIFPTSLRGALVEHIVEIALVINRPQELVQQFANGRLVSFLIALYPVRSLLDTANKLRKDT